MHTSYRSSPQDIICIYSLVSYFRNTNEEERGLKGILTSFPLFLQCLYIFPIFPSCVCLHGVTNNNNILAKNRRRKEDKEEEEEMCHFKTHKAFFQSVAYLIYTDCTYSIQISNSHSTPHSAPPLLMACPYATGSPEHWPIKEL